MKVLLVNDKGWFFGGAEQVVDDIAAGLVERGHQVHLLSSESAPAARRPLAAAFSGRSRVELSAGAETWKRQLDRAVETASPDVVYVHRFESTAALARLVTGQRVVRYVHDHDIYCPRRHKYFPLSARICERPLGVHCVVHGCLLTPRGPVPGVPGVIDLFAKRRHLALNRTFPTVAVGSEWMRQALGSNGFSAGQVVVLPPVPRGIEREPQHPSGERLVLYVGQIVRGKGVDLLLHALAGVRGDYRAIIVGTGNHTATCQRLARELKLGDRVTFVGWVPHANLIEYYRRARLVVVPSRWAEPFGMVGLEAMWASRPVAAFAVGGIPDWLDDGNTGILASERDTRALAHAIDELLGDDALAARMGAAAHARAARRYRFASFLERTESLLAGAGSAAGHLAAGPADSAEGRA